MSPESLRDIEPEDFPFDAWQSLGRLHGPLDPSHPDPQWKLFTGGLNAARYRFIAAAEYDRAFTESISTTGNSGGVRGRFEQERDLFGFYVSALSAIECTLFAVNAIGARSAPETFPLKAVKESPVSVDVLDDAEKDERVDAEKVGKRLRAAFPDEPVTATVSELLTSDQFKHLNRIRNILAHRETPGRNIADDFQTPIQTGRRGLELSTTTTGVLRAWVAEQLAKLFAGAEQLSAMKTTAGDEDGAGPP